MSISHLLRALGKCLGLKQRNHLESKVLTSPRVPRSLTSWPGSESVQTKPHLEPGDLWWRPASDFAGESPHLPFFDHSSAQLGGKLWWALAPDARTSLPHRGWKSVPGRKSTENPDLDRGAIQFFHSCLSCLNCGQKPFRGCFPNYIMPQARSLISFGKINGTRKYHSTTWKCNCVAFTSLP